jgi:hypothetical protein
MGRIGAFQADMNGFSFDMAKTDEMIRLTKENEDSLRIINGLLEREKFYKSKIDNLEDQVKKGLPLPMGSGFVSKVEISKEEAPQVEVGGRVFDITDIDKIVQFKGDELKESRVRLEVQREFEGKIQQQQQQQGRVPQQQQQQGSSPR